MDHIGTQQIETQRLHLRRIEPRDADSFFEMYRHERTVRFLHVPLYTDVSQAVQFVEKVLPEYDNPEYYRWVIELRSGEFVGAISLFSASEQDDVAGVGYSATPSMWGNGYMTEALRAVIGFAFHQVGFNRVQAFHAAQNPASGAVMRKAGMLYEGMLREGFKNIHGYHDSHMYGILKSDY